MKVERVEKGKKIHIWEQTKGERERERERERVRNAFNNMLNARSEQTTGALSLSLSGSLICSLSFFPSPLSPLKTDARAF